MDGTAVVLGAASGIGREIAYNFAEKGASAVIFADININVATQSAKKSVEYATNPNYRPLAVRVDVTDRLSVEKLVAYVQEEFGSIDYAVNSAGVGSGTEIPVTDVPVEEFDRVHDVNARGVLFCTAVITRAMQNQPERFITGRSGPRSIGRGALVNITSLNGIIATPSHVPYISSKFAATGITLTAAIELARSGVRINIVAPGWVDTPLMENDLSRTPELLPIINKLVPQGRMAFVEEIAEVVTFLCSPGASFVHGTTSVIDAGLSLTRGFI